MSKNINYKTGYSFSSRELFDNFNCESFNKNTKVKNHKDYANKIFIKAFSIIIDDIIKNNTTFKLPTTNESYLEVLKLNKENFKKARQKGFFKDIDILKSSFYGVVLQFRYKLKYFWITKRILLDKERRKKLIKNLYIKKY